MKLLNKTLKPFALYSMLVLALSVPVYFFVINFIWKRELDKHHQVIRKEIEKEINALHLEDSSLAQMLEVWNKVQPRTRLTPAPGTHKIKDSIYTTIRYDVHEEEIEQFRGAVTTIIINKKPYHLLVETNMEEFYETLIIIVLVSILFFILLLTGFIILNRRLSVKLWKPFYDTIHRLKLFDLRGQDKISFQPSDIDEFEALNYELSKLIGKNIDAFRQQKEFTENASHELQTPLALLKSKVDLLLQDTSLTKEQSEKIASLDSPLARVSRINKNLLLLAKLENRQFTENETVRVSETLNQNIALLEEHFRAKNILITTNIEADFSINANQGLFEILVTNLLLNAIRHNPLNGKINIRLCNKILIISNSGLSALNSETLFKRFISSSKDMPSSGLGLAIVKEICNTHNWKIDYTFENYLHNFVIRF
ncbi:MAG: HAMP domain-containing histidine kinase [Ferruginibacter sp.]|nr:HAMP domain-containing histidine kinase [Ferruginibacter sp.]